MYAQAMTILSLATAIFLAPGRIVNQFIARCRVVEEVRRELIEDGICVDCRNCRADPDFEVCEDCLMNRYP